MLRTLQSLKKIMVSEYVADNSTIADAVLKNNQEGFLCFPRELSNYDYLQIPTSIQNENANDVTLLSQVQNYLYLISKRGFATKQDFLSAISAINYDAVIIDLFYDEMAFTSSEINQLKIKAKGGQRLVLSYMNIGSAENYRYYWKDKWKLLRPLWLKKEYCDY